MIQKLLQGRTDCPCGQPHSCDVKYISIRSGAVADLEEICRDYRKIILVADNNTYAICGDRVVASAMPCLRKNIRNWRNLSP